MGTKQILGAAAIIAAFSLAWIPGHAINSDFGFDWLVAKAFMDGVDPYQTLHDLADHYDLTSVGGAPHPRIPGALVILSPLSVLPFSWTYEAGRILTVASAVGLVWVFSRISSLRFTSVVYWLPIVLLVPPFSWVLARGQTDFLIAALIGTTLLLAEDDRPFAGIPLGIAVTLKLWAWPLAVALILGRRWRTAMTVGVTFTVLNLIGLASPNVSIAGTLEALPTVWTFYDNSLSVPGVFGVSPVVTGVVLVVGLAVWARFGPGWDEMFVMAVPLALLAAPIMWKTYLVALVVPVAWLVKRPVSIRKTPLPFGDVKTGETVGRIYDVSDDPEPGEVAQTQKTKGRPDQGGSAGP